ncbi:MAG: hypothetical protein HYV61_07800 [Candidatus Rokubacteria bacterium]|nr:hypothetical protein [Candidatus Rokubacteria bacterium]
MSRWPLLLALGLAACAAVPPPPPPLPPLAVPEAKGLLREWEAAWERFPGLRAAVELSLSQKGTTQRTAGVLLLAPAGLRFEALSPFGLPLLIVAADGETVTIWRIAERRAVIAPATAAGIHRWLQLPLAPADLLRLLIGQVRPLPEAESVQTALDDGVPRVELGRGALRQRVWMGPGRAPARVAFTGDRHLQAVFERGPDGGLRAVRLAAPEAGVEVHLRYHTVEVGAVPAELFALRLPAEVKVQRVD